ncbi:MAG: alpha-N-acetylglucosaminidase C-terminal domain-containing protein, partial [Pirellulales bacterium]|nr:alpha-N-acetylglucosaminidase C-terminal domain-containing protein [Pirellulales bacterium]
RYLVADVWAETNSICAKTGHFGGQAEWMFGVLNTFGNVERLHGDLRDLLRRVQHVVSDPQSRRCTGFYINPESTHHNFLYFDFASELAWDPRGIGLDSFLQRYCIRRYGRAAASAMIEVWKRVADTAYADNLEANPRPFYHSALPYDGGGADLFADPRRIAARYAQTPRLWQALRLAVAERSGLENNVFFQRDVIDIARTLLGIEFDYHALGAHRAFTQESNAEGLAAAGRAALDRLDWITALVAPCEEFWLESEMKLGRQRPLRKQPVQSVKQSNVPRTYGNDLEVRLRFTALAGLDKYPGLLDYASTDRVELLDHYYRPRVEAWLLHMQQRLVKGERRVDYGALLQGSYRQIAEAFVTSTPKRVGVSPPEKTSLDVAAALLEKSSGRADLGR